MDEEIFCTCCGKKVNPQRVVMLELDSWTGLYHSTETESGIPEGRSQGCFPFGAACARLQLRKTRSAIAKQEAAS